MNGEKSFYKDIKEKIESFLSEQAVLFPEKEVIRIDLHCHDHNSNVPDETIGRILGVPETWLSTEDLIKTLEVRGCGAFTVTNHNNARSCYELIDKGRDILTGAEFSCMVPDFKTGIHVLAYGFSPEQEHKLNKLRSDIYRFQAYTTEHDIPTIWAHPLYHYKSTGLPPMEFFDKMALLFERFETINGQRDSWQNILVKNWIESLTKENILLLSKNHKIQADRFCRNPYKKSMTGGSDSHMGMFAGTTGTLLHVPGLAGIKEKKISSIALQAIKEGKTAPYGSHNDSEKMALTFLDYFCQIGLNIEDRGLLRMLLHKGDAKEKAIAFAASNAFMELKRHKTTINFLKLFHNCFTGKVPGKLKSLAVPKAYKNVFKIASHMASVSKDNPESAFKTFEDSIYKIYENLSNILITRVNNKFEEMGKKTDFSSIKIEDFLSRIEIPGHFRALFDNASNDSGFKAINLSKFMDGLSFPFLSTSVILAAFFTSARVIYKSRPLLYEFAEKHGTAHPDRTLWLTDTFEDTNGVAMVLKSMLKEIRARNLPIDILTVSNNLISGDHFISMKPIAEFTLPFYEHQPIRIPNILEIHKFFKEGEYSRIICSTEGPMGLIALYLKYAYSVPAHFYVHTDWMTFAEKVLKLDDQNKSRLRRMLRAFYKQFDGLFVLNKEQKKWLISKDMGFNPLKVFLTAHWAEDLFAPKKASKKEIFGTDENDPVILFAGRISDEKGVMEIPLIMERVRSKFPDAKIAFAGTGPKEKELKETMPEAIYLGWVDHDRLPDVYSAADLLILPSRFDTFGCVVLESLSCGLPVIAYNTKGPKDIIINGLNGYLVKSRNEMAAKIIEFLGNNKLRGSFKQESLKRAKDYNVDNIISRFLQDLNAA